MSHFTVGVIVPRKRVVSNGCVDSDKVRAVVEKLLAPYDEGTNVAPYVSFTPESVKAKNEEKIAKYAAIVEAKDEKYNLAYVERELLELRGQTPEQWYAEELKYHEDFNEKGEPLSTYNPNSKWDWWVIGGRWNGWLHEVHEEQERLPKDDSVANNVATPALCLERNKIPYSLVTPDGVWHDKGRMGWWGISTDEDEKWPQKVKEIYEKYSGKPEHLVVLVDCHI